MRSRRATEPLAQSKLAAVGTAIVALIAAAVAAMAGAAPAAAEGPWWRVNSEVAPTYLPPGGEGTVIVTASNLGDEAVNSAKTPVTITDQLPDGVTAAAISGQSSAEGELKCPTGSLPSPPLTCTYSGTLAPYEKLVLTIRVRVEMPPGAVASLANEVAVDGGGAPRTTSVQQLTINPETTPFGLQSYELTPVNEDGTPATQAGAHPFQLTTTLVMNQSATREPVALPKDLHFNLPPGLVGNANLVGSATAPTQCSEADFAALVEETNLCPPSSVLGVASVTAYEPVAAGFVTRTVPVFNLVPALGEPARFGFEVIGKIPVVIDTSVRSGGNYSVVASVEDATQTAGLLSSQVTLWGVPGDARHNESRGWECVAGGEYSKQVGKPCPASSNLPQEAFLTLPTSCELDPTAEPVVSTTEADSWAEPGRFLGGEYVWMDGEGRDVGFEGCSELPYTPSIDVTSEQHSASTPSGLTVDVKVPQQTTVEAGGRAEADVRDTTVTLPEGVQLNPSAATGLAACTESEIGFEGFGAAGMQQFSPSRPTSEEPLCPKASKVGTVEIETPLLSHTLEGSLYLAEPAPNGEAGKNPFNSLVALYLIAEDPVSGVLVKLAGEGVLNESTGQVSTTFRDAPQVPFEDLKVHLFGGEQAGGERASVSTPAFCGSYSSEGSFTPWSGTPAVDVSSPAGEFQVSSGVAGGGCPGSPLSFAPTFSAYSQNTNAGAFTPFRVEIEHPDGQQQLSGLTVRLPKGVAALLSELTPCQEPPAGVEWSCGEASLIGHSQAISGIGDYPVTLEGNVYLTSGYDGAPFGLLVQTLAKAGPFDLGNVNVRSRINVDPNTAAVSITTDPGPRGESFPTMIRGIPAQIKKIIVNVDREHFEFNPTNCDPMKIEGTLTGAEGGSAGVSSPFAVAGCQSLPFKPALTASTYGHASKANGTNFIVDVESGGVGAGGVVQAGVAKVDLQLPKALPARLSTLQKACTEAAFNANPASCPEGSDIGTATIHTPVLKSALSGPAYLVSHGNAGFPDVEFVLQGEGIVLVLDGKTQIKQGITYSKFESAPDAPFTRFETVLPAGPHSALTADVAEKKKYDLCGERLLMPTTITGQNGAVIERNTKIAVQGCAAVKASRTRRLTNAQKLAKALAACRQKYKHASAKRAKCARQARRRFPDSKAKKSVKVAHAKNSKRGGSETAAR